MHNRIFHGVNILKAPHNVMFTTYKSLKMSFGLSYHYREFVRGMPPWPALNTTPLQPICCGNSLLMASQWFSPPLWCIYFDAPQGTQFAPTQMFAKDLIIKQKWHKLKNQLQKNTQNTTSPCELAWPKWKSRNNVYLRPIHPSENKVTMGHNKIFDTPSLIKFIQDVLVGHIQGFLRILKSLFTLDHAIIMQSVPNYLSCFLNGPLQIVRKPNLFVDDM